MRIPNCKCVICEKPLYRRPNELLKVRYVACMEHRSEAQKLSGITDAQLKGLSLGRKKGTNHRTGYKHKEESKNKCSKSHKLFHQENPEAAKKRGEKTRGELNYKWKGGSSKLNVSIRQMTENRKWMDAIKERDAHCLCGSSENLESHHIISLAVLIVRNKIKNRDDARNCPDLWDINNGLALCKKCHYKIHGRKYED